MILLPGIGAVRRPAALGVAARIAWQHGRPTLSEETLGWLAERVRREEGQIQLILLVDEAAPALWMPLPYDAVLAGVVAEKPFTAGTADVVPIPVVAEVAEARASIGEGTLLLIDPHRNVVCVEPSADEVLAVERRRRRRVLLGPEHTPATTRTGVTVPVWGRVRNLGDARTAVDGGADGLFVTFFQDFGEIAEAARFLGGGPVAAAIPAPDAFTLARDIDIVRRIEEVRDDASAWEVALAQSAPGTEPPRRIGTFGPDLDPSEVDPGLDGLVANVDQLPLPVLDLPPLWVLVDDVEDVGGAVTAGAAVLIAPPDRIQAVKDAVRSTD